MIFISSFILNFFTLIFFLSISKQNTTTHMIVTYELQFPSSITIFMDEEPDF